MKWLVVLAIMAAGGSVYNELKSPDVDYLPAPAAETCMNTPQFATTCGESAVTWCETNSHDTVVGYGDDSQIVRVVNDPLDAEACARVGWIG